MDRTKKLLAHLTGKSLTPWHLKKNFVESKTHYRAALTKRTIFLYVFQMHFVVYTVLIVVCTVSRIFAAPATIGEMNGPRGRRDTTDGDKEKGDFLSSVATAANAAKLVAQYGCPIARLAYTQCNKEQNPSGYNQKLIDATWEHFTKDVDQGDGATVAKAIREYGCPAVGFVTKLCVLA